MDNIILQIVLMTTIFLIGILTAVGFRHAREHFKPQTPEPEEIHSKQTVKKQAPEVHLSPAIKERLLMASQTHLQAVLNRSASELQHDLRNTSMHLNQQLRKLGAEIVSDEMKRYHNGLDQLRKQAEKTIVDATSEIAKHQADLKAKIDEQQTRLEKELNDKIASEKQLVTSQLDTKIADILTSFLTESLQHNIDLGSQNDYLLDTLKNHKAELIKEITDEN